MARTVLSRQGVWLLGVAAVLAGPQATAQNPQLPAPPASAAPPEDGQWTMPAKNYASTRYSELDRDHADNVKNLQVAFTFSTGVNRGQEAAPLVVGDTMYIVSPYPNILYALDLTQPGAPMKWKYEPKPEPAAQGVACCDVVNRGADVSRTASIFFNTLDGNVVAVDADTGKEVWKHQGRRHQQRRDHDDGAAGREGQGAGRQFRRRVRRARLGRRRSTPTTGKIVWKAYSTGPGQGRADRAGLQAVLRQRQGQGPRRADLAAGRLAAGRRHRVGLDLLRSRNSNLIYHGTANPGPWNSDQRPGDNKWTAGIFARDADTGEARWFYQWSPHDLYDWDGINENILLDMRLERAAAQGARASRAQRLHLRARPHHRRGAVGEPFVPITTTTGVDLKTGRLQYVADKQPQIEQGRARHLPRRARRQGLEPLRLLAEDRAALHPAQQSVHGRASTSRRTTSPARPMSAPRCA